MKDQKVDRFLVYGLLLIVFLIFLAKIMPPSNTGNVKEHEAKEAVLKHEIHKRDLTIKDLKKRDAQKTEIYEHTRDSLIALVHKPRNVEYVKAVEATDLRPDSLNLLNEVNISRKIIHEQESYINALLDLNLKSDSLLKLRREIIEAQDLQIADWEDRYNNVLTLKDAEIKAEKKRGVKRFFKGVAVGGLVTLILVL
jgi:uncharacterized protein YhaN